MEQAAANTSKRRTSTVKTLQWITVAWMSVELCISLFAGVRARSVALTAFGADSTIELISAIVVLRRFALGPGAERRAARVSGTLLYILAAYILVSSSVSLFSTRFHAEPTVLGIALLIAAAIVMPLLGRAKKRLAGVTGSRALKADAAQSNICAYMSWIALAGLVVNAIFHVAWADPAAAFFLLPLVVKEAKEAREGLSCSC